MALSFDDLPNQQPAVAAPDWSTQLNFSDLERQHGLPSGLLNAVMHQESRGDPNAVSPKGATGLFQFMPETAQAYGINPRDPAQSADGAARMYGDLSRQYNGDVPKMLAGYNWGGGNMARQGFDNRPPETQDYISKVMARMPVRLADSGQIMNDASRIPSFADLPDAAPAVPKMLAFDDLPNAAPAAAPALSFDDIPNAPPAPPVMAPAPAIVPGPAVPATDPYNADQWWATGRPMAPAPETPSPVENKTFSPVSAVKSIGNDSLAGMNEVTAGIMRALSGDHPSEGAQIMIDQARQDAAMQRMQSDAASKDLTTWQEVKDNPLSAAPARFAGESILSSLPYMAASLTPEGLAAIAATSTGNIARTRAENSSRPDPSATDFAVAAPAGIAQAGLESFGAGKVLAAPVKKTAVGFMKSFLKSIGYESSEEAAQQAAQYLGETLGTDKTPSVQEALPQIEAAAAGGAVAGGGIHAGHSAVHGAMEKFQEAKAAAQAAPEPVQPGASGATAPEAAGSQPTPPQPAPAEPIQPISPTVAEMPQSSDITATNSDKNVTLQRVVTPDNQTKIDVKPEVIDAKNLISSDNPQYPVNDLQPRDRTRDVSERFVQETAAKLNPDLLGSSPTTESGAPIIGMHDNLVESGNGRVMAIKRAYEQHPAQAAAYRAAIEAQGHDTTGMAQPVLVRRRMTDMTPEQRQKFTRDSNASAVASYSSTEKAAADAKNMGQSVLLHKGGDVTSLANADFVRQFIRSIPKAEHGSVLDKNGNLSQEGQDRARAMLMHAAYGDANLTSAFSEDANPDVKSIGNALTNVAGDYARLKEKAKNGSVPSSLDISKNIAEAVATIRDARKNNTPISEVLTQQKMFADQNLSPITKKVIEAFYQPGQKRLNSSAKIEQTLRKYAQEAEKAQPGAGLLGNETTPEDILNAIKPKEDASTQSGMNFSGEANSLQENSSTLPGTISDGRTLEDMSATDRPSFRRQMFEAMGLDPEKAVNMAPNKIIPLAARLFKSRFGIDVERTSKASPGKVIDNLTDAWINFQQMARVLGIPDRALGLQGVKVTTDGVSSQSNLRLIFAGNKGQTLGVFSPSDNSITIANKARSFAHEWGHALDYHILRAMGKTVDGLGNRFRGFTSRIRREGLHDFEPASVSEAWVNLMNTMFFDDALGSAKVLELEQKMERTKSDKIKAQMQEQIDKIAAGNYLGHDYRSPYYKGADSIPKGSDKSYWTRPTEMLARAWEAYVSMKVENAGGSTEMLGMINDAYMNGADERIAATYPQADDRARIFLAMDKMMEAVRNADLLDKGNLSTAELPMAGDEKNWRKMAADDEHVSLINRLKDFVSGESRRAMKEAAALEKSARELRPTSPVSTATHFKDLVRQTISSSRTGINSILARNKAATSLRSLARSVATKPGSGEYQPNTYFEDVHKIHDKYMNALTDVMKNNKLKQANTAEMKLLNEMLQGLPETEHNLDSNRLAAVKKSGAEMRDIYNKLYYELDNSMKKNTGKGLNFYGDAGYMNQIFDRVAIEADQKGATKDFKTAYEIEFDKEFGEGQDINATDFLKAANGILGYGDPGVKALAAAIKEATAEDGTVEITDAVREEIDNMYDEVKDGVTSAQADALLSKLLVGDELQPGVTSSAGFTKSRTLSADTIPVLSKWRVNNPLEAQTIYISKAARHMAWMQHFGNIDEKLKQSVLHERVPSGDAQLLKTYIYTLTGKQSNKLPSGQANIVNSISANLVASLLGRSVFASLSENHAVGLRTGRVRDSYISMYQMMKAIVNTKDMKEIRKALEAAGALKNVMTDASAIERTVGTYDSDPRTQKWFTQFFENNLVSPLTRVQRLGTAVTGAMYLKDLANTALEKTDPAERAKALELFKEYGINTGIAENFAKYLKNMTGIMPDASETGQGKDTSPFADLYMAAISRFHKQGIQDPDASSMPLFGHSNYGRFLYSLMRFNYSYWEHSLKSNKHFFMAEKGKSNAALAAAKTFARFAPTYLNYLAWTAAIFALRTAIYNPERWDEWGKDDKEKTGLAKYQNQFIKVVEGGISYTLPLGPAFDVLYNAITGLRYEKDLTSITAGATPGWVLGNIQTMVKSFTNNSPHNNTGERNRVKAIYNMTMIPLSTWITGHVPGVAGKLVGLANSFITSPLVTGKVMTAVAGPKHQKTDDTGD